ncbi:HAD family hydrolase [Neobacillus drentensis]|uniref:HAD family hydrolase n=1 Tax=Neobacillus drentensis TaxID=220684 RepID=UPI002FFF14D9
MIKLLAFDIDNTLALINEPILFETVSRLKQFENSGLKIAFVSGKPAIYLSGLARQAGLKAPIIIGENGLNIYYGCSVPPLKVIDTDVDLETHEILHSIKNEIITSLGDKIWFQPNAVSVTAFPKDYEDMPALKKMVAKLFQNDEVTSKLVSYTHLDSIDIAPKLVNKGNALSHLLKLEGWQKEDVIAIGDGENDIPMFEQAGFSIGINFMGQYTVNVNVNSIHEALDLLQIRC